MTVFDRRFPGADTAVGALTPEGIEFVLFPAGLPVRACAYAIDKIVQWVVLIVVQIVSSLNGGAWLLLILNFCVDWFYHVFFELMFRGQSPGKYLMGIRVVRSDGAPVDGSSSFLRNLLRFADTFCFLCPIALVSMAASSGFRRLGDWAGSTLVVYAPRGATVARKASAARSAAGLSPAAQWLLPVSAVVPARPLSADEKQAVLVFARRYPLLGTARADEIARSWVPFLRCKDCLQNNSHDNSLSVAPDDAPPFSPTDGQGACSDAEYLLGVAKTLLGAAAPEAPQSGGGWHD